MIKRFKGRVLSCRQCGRIYLEPYRDDPQEFMEHKCKCGGATLYDSESPGRMRKVE